MGLPSLLLVGYERGKERKREGGAFVGRLCKQKFFQDFRRVRVREESEGAEKQGCERCSGREFPRQTVLCLVVLALKHAACHTYSRSRGHGGGG